MVLDDEKLPILSNRTVSPMAKVIIQNTVVILMNVLLVFQQQKLSTVALEHVSILKVVTHVKVYCTRTPFQWTHLY